MIRAWPALILLAALSVAPRPQAQAAEAPTWRIAQRELHVEVGADGGTVSRIVEAYTALTAEAARELDEKSVHYHARGDRLRDLVAYTQKADGRRVEVPPGNVQVTTHSGIEGLPPAFSDIVSQRLVYPDFQAGDTAYLAYTLEEAPTFAGRYSLMHRFRDDVPTDAAVLSVTAAPAVALKVEAYHVDPATLEQLADGRQRWTWRYTRAKPVDRDDESTLFTRAWRYADRPLVLVTNFIDYLDVAAAYQREAGPLARPSARVAALARSLVADSDAPRVKAEKLYTWVQKEISFAGNCLAGGDVVPRGTDLVLDMKRGDCKDHATLLEALLASVGVASSQALVHAGDMYELPALPCWQAFNHVVNYLPAFDLFVDATSSEDPFGELPSRERGKPMLLTAAPAALRTAPTAPPGSDWSLARNVVDVSPEGDIEVEVRFSFGGGLAHAMRNQFQRMRGRDEDRGAKLFRRYFESDGYAGSGFYSRMDDTERVADTFGFDAKYHIEDYLDTGNPYGVRLEAYFPSPMPISALAAFAAAEYPHDFLCGGDRRTEELVMRFPANVTLLAIPRNVTVTAGDVRYEAKYTRTGNELRVERTVTDDSRGPICGPASAAAYRVIGAAVMKDLKLQAIYQPLATP